jgi:hypothetical protein
MQKLGNSLKLRKACGLSRIPNKCLRHLPRTPLLYLTDLFNHCLRLSHFPEPWKKTKVIKLPKPRTDPKLHQNLCPGNLFVKVILKIIQKHTEERGLLNTSQLDFLSRHNTTLQCVGLTDHVILNFNNNMSIASVFLDIEKAFDKTWHLGLLYKLSELKISDKSNEAY